MPAFFGSVRARVDRMGSRAEVLRLYRTILKLAQRYPSSNRQRMIREIKLDFKEGKGVTDKDDLAQRMLSARQGVLQLQQYTGLDQSDDDWEVNLNAGYPTGRS